MEIYLPSKNNAKSSTHREIIKKESQEKKKNILHLIFKYLLDNNLTSTAEALQNETQVGLQYQVCDNIDLEIVVEEFQSYYYMKYQKNAKIVRKLNENDQVVSLAKKRNTAKDKPKKVEENNQERKEDTFQFEIQPLSKKSAHEGVDLKSLCDYENYCSEWREMADQVVKQIVPKTLGITFKDCIGLEETVERLSEAIIYPLKYPELFQNLCTWKGILLYGPPGTGKTLLAKALACESTSTVLNVTSSAFVSKWRGESEKMVKVLFDVAKLYAPSTIFIDEIDALVSTNHDSNHEASRRFKSELLTQIDGILKSDEIFILATTNNPWSINNALLRRFEKRILVPLPEKQSRTAIYRYYFNKHGHGFSDEELRKFADLTEYFSGSDLKCVCKEVEMIIVREKLEEIKSGKWDRKKIITRRARNSDVAKALEKIKPCIEDCFYQKYLTWNAKYGAV